MEDRGDDRSNSYAQLRYGLHAHQRAAFDSWFLDRFGIKRLVEVSAPTLAAPPLMVVGTDRIATAHKRLALQAEKVLPIKL